MVPLGQDGRSYLEQKFQCPFWHKADMSVAVRMSAIGGKAEMDHGGDNAISPTGGASYLCGVRAKRRAFFWNIVPRYSSVEIAAGLDRKQRGSDALS
jgi:hypothetical protein